MMAVPDGSPDFDVVLAFGSPTRVFVAGEVDIATAPLLAAALAKAEARRRLEAVGEPLALDLSAVTFLDASGLRVLAAAARRAPLPVVLRRPTPMMLRVLEITGLLGAFAIDRGDDPAAQDLPAPVAGARGLA